MFTVVPKNESDRLKALREYQILDTPTEDAYDDLTRRAANICGTPVAAVTLVDAERLWFKSIQGLSVAEIPRDAAFCTHTILQSDLLIIPDTHRDKRFAENPFVTGNPHFRFYAGAPLLTPEGQSLGALCVLDTTPRTLTASQQSALRVLANQVVSQFELTKVVMSQEKLLDAQEKAAAALRESEARFRQMADAIPHLAWTATADGSMDYCNQRWYDYTGLTFEETKGWSWSKVIHPEDFEEAVAVWRTALQTQRFSEFEYRLRRADGEFRWYLGRTEPIFDGNGTLVKWVGTGTDIEDFKQAEQKRKASEEERRRSEESARLLGEAVANAVDGVIMADPRLPDCPVVYCNPAFLALTGYAEAEVLGRNCRFLQGPETSPAGVQEIRAALKAERGCQVTLRNYKKDGTPFWINLTLSPVRDAEGSLTHFVGIQHDVTAATEAANVVQETERRLHTVLESMSDAVVALDTQWRYTYVNTRAAEIFSRRPEDMIGKHIWTEFPEGIGQPFYHAYYQAVAEQKPIHFEEHYLPYDRWFENRIYPSPEGLSIFFHDITDRKQHERELERLNRLYAALSQINQTLVRRPARAELFRQVCRILVEQGGFQMAWIGWHTPDSHRLVPVAAWGDQDGYLQKIQIYTDDRPEGRGPAGTSFREGRPYICNRIAGDPALLPWRMEIARHGIEAVSVFPIRLKGEVCGTLTVYAAEPEVFQAREVALLAEAAADISFALDNLAREDERRGAEEARDRFIAVLDATPDFVGMTDPHGRNLYLNQAARRMLGLEENADATELSIAQCHPPESARQIVADGIPGAMRAGVWTGETAVLHRDGSETPISQVILAHKDSAGTVRFFSTVGRDMTERKRAERFVRESEERLKFALNAAQIGDWDMDLRTNVARRSLRHDQCFGYREAVGEWGYDTFLAHVHPVDRDRVNRCYQKAMAGEGEYDVEFQVTWPDASVHWLWSKGQFYFDETGAPYRVAGIQVDVTDRVQVQNELQKSQDRLVLALEAGGLGTYYRDIRTGHFLDISETCKGHFGFAPNEEISYADMARVRHPEDRAWVMAALTQAQEDHHEFQLEYRVFWPDGSLHWIASDGRAVYSQTDEVLGIIGVTQDITERRQAEKQIRLSEANLVAAQQIAHLGSWELDLVTIDDLTQGGLRWSNEVFRIWGHEPGGIEVTYENFLAAVHPDDQGLVGEAVATAVRESRPYDLTHRIFRPDGTERIVREQAEFQFDAASGLPIRMIGTVHDITEQRRSEENIRFQSLLLSQVRNAVIATDLEGQITYWNSYAEALYQWRADEVLGRNIVDVTVPQQLRTAAQEVIGTVTEATNWEGEFEVQKKDGSVFPAYVVNTLFRDAYGTVTGMVGVSIDITERKLAEAQIQDLNQTLEKRVEERTVQLEALNREMEAFSYSVSHDLRAPLRSIDGFSQALLEDYADSLDATGQEFLARVRAASQRMSVLIDDLLRLSRVTRGEMRRETMDLSTLAAALSEELARTHPGRSVETVIAPGLSADADPRLMRVVLENLLTNAWKYTAKHETARIEFGQTEHRGRRCFYVRDDGAGFDMVYADKLFSAFHRLHTPREFEGTGIGLATVQRILQRHGGRIWAEAAVERGATFYFVLG